jgi:ribosome-binding factor A
MPFRKKSLTRRRKFSASEVRRLAGRDDLTRESDDPLQRALSRATAPHHDRKAMQLCRQIERELTLILSGELNDDRIRDLMVISVIPYPNTNLLLVTLQSTQLCTHQQLCDLDAVMAAHKPTIRAEVAAAIHRRKTPDLCFRVINAQ